MSEPNRPRIVRAANDLLFADDGRRYVDLFTAHGTTFLGHARPEIAVRVAAQLGEVWITGGLDTPAAAAARRAIERIAPADLELAALYSTGMEAAEFAIRFARVTTGRPGTVGFAQSMHGKSLATAFLGWDNHDDVRLPDFQRLPFLPDVSESQCLDRLELALRRQNVAAVFVEPIQGSGGGRSASAGFHREVARLCREHGALLVFDELLTGLHRTGPAFRFLELGVAPDVVLIGKALGNGFPVSAVVADRRHPVRPEMLPGSTYAGNALACTAVAATLELMQALNLAPMVRAIETTIVEKLAPAREAGVALRGQGALWVAELPGAAAAQRAAVDCYLQGVCVGFAGRHVRLLPAATIEPANLAEACTVVARALAGALESTRGANG